MYCATGFSGWHGFFGLPFGLIFFGFAVWTVLHLFKKERVHESAPIKCESCQSPINANWKYCPTCGKGSTGKQY